MALTGDFDPSDNTTVWRQSGMTTHPTNGQTMDALDDVGDAADNALFADATGPLWISNGINGLGAIDFNGTNQRLRAYNDAFVLQRNVSAFLSPSAYTVMVAFQMEADATNDADQEDNTALMGDFSFDAWSLNCQTSAGVHTLHLCHRVSYAGGGMKVVSQTFTRDQSTVALARFDGTDIFISVNGAAESSFTTGGNIVASGLDNTLMVALATSGVFFPGKIGQLRLWNTGDADANLAAEWSAFQAKWMGAGASSTFPALTVAL